jgi:hypothetical protein
MLARTTRAAAAVVIGLVTGSVALAAPAFADYVVCPTPTSCYIVVTGPGDPGGGGGGGGGTGGGDDGGGEPTGCIYTLADPQPPAGDPAWQGHAPGDGAVYVKMCKAPGGPTGITFTTELIWSGGAPVNTLTPAQLAQEAIKELPLRGPDIGISANLTPNGSGLVGLPVWMWTAVTPETWGPISRTAAVPGLSVTATAKAQRIDWNMGDGHTVTCANPGTPYKPSYGGQSSPTCGYTYSAPSRTRPGGKYAITATTTWLINWAGGGQTGSLTVTRQSQATVQIQESQVVTS